MSGPSTDEYRGRLWIAFRRAGGLPKLSRTLEGRNAIVETCALEAQAAFLVLAAERDARIAELKAERDQARECLDQQRDNYAVLLAERDAIRKVMKEIAGTAEIGLNIGPVIRLAARSLLSEGGGE